MSGKMKKSSLRLDDNYPFSIKPCSMSYSQDDEDYEIIYNGTDFEIVPIDKSKKYQSSTSSNQTFNMNDLYDVATQMGFDSDDWETDWMNDWNTIEKDLTEKKCKHEWKATQLVFNTVYDCVKCGAKKEENK
jgi:hypothetical protein